MNFFPEISAHRLANGLLVLTAEIHSLPILSHQVHFAAGSRYEKPGITGISHLFEHLMFKGTRRVKPEEFARIIQAHGGTLNAFTTTDNTSYYENLPAEKLELAMDLEADRLRQSAADFGNPGARTGSGPQRTQAPLRQQPLRPAHRTTLRPGLRTAPVPLAGHRLGRGSQNADAGRLPGVLPHALFSQQCRGRSGRRRRGRGCLPPRRKILRPDPGPDGSGPDDHPGEVPAGRKARRL